MIDAALRLVFEFMHETMCPLLTRTDLLATGGDLDALLRAKLLKRAEDLEEILHHDGTLMAVRKLPHGIHGVAADPEDYFPPIPLEEDAVIAYEVNVPVFIKTLCEGNEISGAKPIKYSSPIYLGTKSLGGWGVLEVYLAYPNAEMRDVLALCSSLQPQQQNQAIGLLVPGPLPTDPGLTAIMEAHSIVPIPLSDHVATATFAIDWHVAIGAKTPSISPGQQGDPLNRFVPRKIITQIFSIDDETIRRYDKKGQTPNGKPWHFMQDPNDKRRKLYNLRMAFDALTAQRMRAEYRDRGEKALAEILDAGESEDSVYQVRKSPNGFMHT